MYSCYLQNWHDIPLHPLSYDGKTKKPALNEIEITATTVRCGMGQPVCRRRDETGIAWQTVGYKAFCNWKTTPYSGMVELGNKNRRRYESINRGRERSITRFPVPVP